MDGLKNQKLYNFNSPALISKLVWTHLMDLQTEKMGQIIRNFARRTNHNNNLNCKKFGIVFQFIKF